MTRLLPLLALLASCAPSQYHATVGRSRGELEGPKGGEWDNSAWYAETGLTWDLIDLQALSRPAPPPQPVGCLDLQEEAQEDPTPTTDLQALAALIAALASATGGAWWWRRRQDAKA